MNLKNSERFGDLRLSLMTAVIQVCHQKLHFIEFVHITGCLSFSIDNAEKLDVVFSEVVRATPPPPGLIPDVHGSSLLLSPSTEPETSIRQRRGRPRKCKSASKEDLCVQQNTEELTVLNCEEGVKLQDDPHKINQQELETTKELFQMLPADGVSSTCPSVNKELVNSVLENRAHQTELLSKGVDNTVTESKSHNNSEKRFCCDSCDFMTDHSGHFHSHRRRHSGARSQACDTCHKAFVTTAELKRHVTQVHERQVKCPQCSAQFTTSVKVKKHLKVAHGVSEITVSCQSCSQRFVKVELLQEHIRARHEIVCLTCNAIFPDRRKLVLHRRTEHPDAELKCIRCGHRCPTKGALRKHMLGHRDRILYKCDQCEKRFTSGSSLYHHKRAMHSDHKPYQCEICSASFNFNNSMKLHMLRHCGQRPHKCAVCNKSYLTASHLKHHVRAVHDESKPFRCSTCGKTFPYENSLRLHKMLHTGERPFTCSFCGKSFVSRSALRTHEESHADNVAYTCDVCHKSYKTASLLRAHRRRHTADGERFICDVCGRRFMYRSNLEAHCSVHSDVRAHVCSTCAKRFKTYAALYSHLQVHLSSSPFVCTKCGKTFKTKERLKAHEHRHLGEKPFICQLCNNAFPDKGGLTKHAKSVHAVTPRYACPACNKTCNRADNLRVHMKVHGNSALLKLSLQELSVALPEELPAAQPENHTAVTLLAFSENTPMQEMESGSNGLIAHDLQCLPTVSNNMTDRPMNLPVNSGTDSIYSHNFLGVYTRAAADGNQYDSRFLRASQGLNSSVLGMGQRSFPALTTYDFSLGFENPMNQNQEK